LIKKVTKSKNINSKLRIAGDKSISHRAAILNAMAHGTAEVTNFCVGDDQESVIRTLRSLGTKIIHKVNHIDDYPIHSFTIHGNGSKGFTNPTEPLDCGNSGTCMRLLSGVVAGQNFKSILIGDNSLSKRPMNRIAKPLIQMGAKINSINSESIDNITAPFEINGGDLNAIQYISPVSSAQVKSCVLLAGIQASGKTTFEEPFKSRDHTERMLSAMGAKIKTNKNVITIEKSKLTSQNILIPSDISSAAFWMVLGSCHDNAEIYLPNIGLNPNRTGILEVLIEMGANLTIENKKEDMGEPRGDILIKSSKLKGITIDKNIIPKIIDEIPILSLAACFANSETIIKDAEELRIKESDRIKATVDGLYKLGANIKETKDGMIIKPGNKLTGNKVESYGDHRIAMMLGIAGLLSEGTTVIEGAEHASVSYPNFWDEIDKNN
tara:strand:+ start:1060 stop:2373 length:1314 start_codon:yes stop_codon:yes gene_type:complete